MKAKNLADVATAAQENSKRDAENAEKAAAEATRQERLAAERARESRAVLDFVENKILAAARPKGELGGLGREVTLRKALEEALPQVETSFQGQPLVEASVRMTLGQSFAYLGDAATAEKQFQIARARYTARAGPRPPRHAAEHEQPRQQLRRPGPARRGAEALARRRWRCERRSWAPTTPTR